MEQARKTGYCYCGCGDRTRSYFAQGHDRRAESMLIEMVFGSLAQMIEHYGFGPNETNLSEMFDRWKASNGPPLIYRDP